MNEKQSVLTRDVKSSCIGSKKARYTTDITHQSMICAGPKNIIYANCDQIGVVKNYICLTPVYSGELNVHNLTFSDGEKFFSTGNDGDADNDHSVNVIGHILAGGFRTPDICDWESFSCICIYGKKCPKRLVQV